MYTRNIMEWVVILSYWGMLALIVATAIHVNNIHQVVTADRSDVNGDGVVNLQDVSIVMSAVEK